MNEAIRKQAQELGFDGCRFTIAQAPQSAPHFQNWLAQGRQGEMAYLERNAQKRLDLQKVLPGARSVITLAVAYGGVQSPESVVSSQWSAGEAAPGASIQYPASSIPEHAIRNPQHERQGRIARYARYDDYHDIIGERLKSLTEFINEIGGPATRSLWYVDTGPLLERDLAQRAGLGFIGKHTNLINRQLGNWFFLCEIITTHELQADPPERNHCGTCTRCLAACPTGAITAPFELDARRCISYLTIELKGSIPVEFRPAIVDRVYGCDICLEVCPWNRFAREGRLMQIQARPDLATPDLLELLSLDEDGFKRRFSGAPMLRAKRRGLLRNVCVALGNVGDASALAALRRSASDPEPLIAEHARWAIKEIEKRVGFSRT